MTLKDYLDEHKVLYTEVEPLRAICSRPDTLGWSNDMWTNRYKGRTSLRTSEIFALDKILWDIRHTK